MADQRLEKFNEKTQPAFIHRLIETAIRAFLVYPSVQGSWFFTGRYPRRSWRRVCDWRLRETARIFGAPTVMHISDYLGNCISIIKGVGCRIDGLHVGQAKQMEEFMRDDIPLQIVVSREKWRAGWRQYRPLAAPL